MPTNPTTHLIFVEKKPPFNVEATHLLNELRHNLSIKNLTNVQILNKYLIKGVDQKTFLDSLDTVFSEPPVDILHLEKFPKKPLTNTFGIAFLPGQFDQRADSVIQCLKLLNPKLEPLVNTAKVYVLSGRITKKDLNNIKQYLINTVDSQEVGVDMQELFIPQVHASSIETITDFCR
jgi:phosphoribosylformylglycinamidine synthase